MVGFKVGLPGTIPIRHPNPTPFLPKFGPVEVMIFFTLPPLTTHRTLTVSLQCPYLVGCCIGWRLSLPPHLIAHLPIRLIGLVVSSCRASSLSLAPPVLSPLHLGGLVISYLLTLLPPPILIASPSLRPSAWLALSSCHTTTS